MKVVVIGAGVAGLSIGWRLAQSGCEIVVLERAQPARGATWAAGGMIAATAENVETSTPEARFAQHAADMWPSFAAEIEEHAQHPIHYRRDGTLIAATSQETLKVLSARAGAKASLLGPKDVLGLEPALRRDVLGGLWAPEDAQVDNRALGIALALAFVNAGGTLQINEAAVCFEMRDERTIGVRTPFHLYEADVFVIAAGAWSGELRGLPPAATLPVVPVKGEMLALASPHNEALPRHLVWGDGVYLVPRHDRLLVGATVAHEGFDTHVTEDARRWLLDRAKGLMPALDHWQVVDQWAGLRPGTPDDMPIIGETVVPGVFAASGQYRNGILFAPAIADALRGLVTEHRAPVDICAFDPKRFEGAPLVDARAVR